jgi:hypothetical protein
MTQMRERLDIEVVRREVERLATVQAGWAAFDPEDRVAFRAEWHDLMDIFGHLVATYAAGRLDEDDARDLRSVASILTDALPIVERMRLRQPDPELLARIRLAAAS